MSANLAKYNLSLLRCFIEIYHEAFLEIPFNVTTFSLRAGID
jgi:hypothetical protein